MNCIDAQQLIMPFISDLLDIKQLDEFIDHMNSCPHCMEELEVYFVLLTSMKQLDEEKDMSSDYHEDLMNRLKESEERIIHHKFVHIRKRIVLSVIISFMAIISSVSIGEYVVEDLLNKKVTKSDYLVNELYQPRKFLYSSNDALMYRNTNIKHVVLYKLFDIYVYLSVENKDSAKLMEKKYGNIIWEDEIIEKGVGLQIDIPTHTILYY